MDTLLSLGLLVVLNLSVETQSVPESLLDWWSPEFLSHLHQERLTLEAQRKTVSLDDGLQEYRAVIHCHSRLSHDSRGTLEELIAAAHASDTQVVLMTEHPSREHDVYAEGWSGSHEGVLFLPGAETRNLIVWPRTRADRWDAPTRQTFVDQIRADGGLVFICHPDTFDEWEIQGVQGMEIYNIHADAKDESEFRRLFGGAPHPELLSRLILGYRKYPLEAMAAIFDEPTEFVRRWDALLQRGPITAVGGNDAHQNTGFVLRVGEEDTLEIRSVLDEPIATLTLEAIPLLGKLVRRLPPGSEVRRLQLDPYSASFQFVGTHILATELSESAIREALARGHAFVAFGWLANARGFTAVVESEEQRWVMGDPVPWQKGLRLRAEAPLPVRWRLIRNGEITQRGEGRTFEVPLSHPGVYRVEARLALLSREWPWIYANPFYVTNIP